MHSDLESHLNQIHLEGVASFLGFYFIALAVMNGVAAYRVWHRKHETGQAIFWLIVAAFYMGYLAPMSFSANPKWTPQMPGFIRQFVNDSVGGSTGAVVYTVGIIIFLSVLYVGRRFFVRGPVAWTMLNLSLLILGLSMADRFFFAIAAKPDNVPIVGL
ncbi:MAG: hypothetical protein N2C12_02820, partial [Planctomycetales bacterium]